MEDRQKEILEQLEVNIEPTINRFVDSEEFYFEMLEKFRAQDHTFETLTENVGAKDYAAAFKDAHTLKGVVANLGLELINDTVKPLTEELRNPPYDEEKIQQLFEESKVRYNKGMELLDKLQ